MRAKYYFEWRVPAGVLRDAHVLGRLVNGRWRRPTCSSSFGSPEAAISMIKSFIGNYAKLFDDSSDVWNLRIRHRGRIIAKWEKGKRVK